MARSEGVDKRRSHRVKVRWPVVIMTSKGPVVGETRNIGDKGAFIYCKEFIHPKERCRLFIMIPDHTPVIIPVRIAWSNPYGSEIDATPCGVGVRFSDISAADREKMVHELENRAAEEDTD
jgi:Tfp pilus assembly protein PilZ